MGAFDAIEVVLVFELSAGSQGVDFFFGATVTDDVTVLAASGVAISALELMSCTCGIPVVAVTLASPLVVSSKV